MLIRLVDIPVGSPGFSPSPQLEPVEIKCKRRDKQFLGILLSAIILGCSGCDHVGSASFHRSQSTPFTDQEALLLSRNTMQKLVPNFTNYEADRYDGTNYFARNTYNSNDGYVLWRQKGDLEKGFRVAIAADGTNVVCEVLQFE
jgi:hypothetical protein